MIGFDQAKADAAVTAISYGMVRVFCNIECRIDWGNKVPHANCPYMPGLPMYGCWQCGEDLMQGMLLDKPMDDDNAYRRRRVQS